VTSFSAVTCKKWQHWERGSHFFRLVRPELLLYMSHLILRDDMKWMTTLRMRSSISETCLTEINAMPEWPHSQRWYAISDNTENEFSICEIYVTKANAMHALTHSQTWNAIYAHTVSDTVDLLFIIPYW